MYVFFVFSSWHRNSKTLNDKKQKKSFDIHNKTPFEQMWIRANEMACDVSLNPSWLGLVAKRNQLCDVRVGTCSPPHTQPLESEERLEIGLNNQTKLQWSNCSDCYELNRTWLIIFMHIFEPHSLMLIVNGLMLVVHGLVWKVFSPKYGIWRWSLSVSDWIG